MMETVVVNGTQVISRELDNTTIVVTGLLGPKSELLLSQANDIDFSGLKDGATLVYNSGALKWQATDLLNKQAVECGEF